MGLRQANVDAAPWFPDPAARCPGRDPAGRGGFGSGVEQMLERCALKSRGEFIIGDPKFWGEPMVVGYGDEPRGEPFGQMHGQTLEKLGSTLRIGCQRRDRRRNPFRGVVRVR